MKVPPKRKGNAGGAIILAETGHTLNESPSEKEGKSACTSPGLPTPKTLNESPSEKEGKYGHVCA